MIHGDHKNVMNCAGYILSYKLVGNNIKPLKMEADYVDPKCGSDRVDTE